MSQIPEGATTVHGEGPDLKKAILAAAGELGIDAESVGYKIDMDHFRGAGGRTSVKVIAWASESSDAADPQKLRSLGEPREDAGEDRRERGERRERRDRDDRRERRDRGDRGDRGERRERRDRDDRRERRDRDDRKPRGRSERKGAEEGTTEASDFAAAWLTELLGHMELSGTVTGTGSEERVHLAVSVDKAGRLIGRRGATLSAIRHMLKLAVVKFGEPVIDVDVADERGGEEREERRDRDDRRDRRDRDRGDRRGKGDMTPEKLQEIAEVAAARAIDSGKVITVSKELNSYDRRLIHVAISEIDGVESRSVERDGVKYVQIVPAASEDEDE